MRGTIGGVLTAAVLVAGALALAGCGGSAKAGGEAGTVPVAFKDHKVVPSEIRVPANQAVVLKVTNADPIAEEFDSPSLGVEKVVAGGGSGLVRLRPLAPGRYAFTGEYHAKTAQGVVVAE